MFWMLLRRDEATLTGLAVVWVPTQLLLNNFTIVEMLCLWRTTICQCLTRTHVSALTWILPLKTTTHTPMWHTWIFIILAANLRFLLVPHCCSSPCLLPTSRLVGQIWPEHCTPAITSWSLSLHCSGSFKVSDFRTNRKPIHDFLLVNCCNQTLSLTVFRCQVQNQPEHPTPKFELPNPLQILSSNLPRKKLRQWVVKTVWR